MTVIHVDYDIDALSSERPPNHKPLKVRLAGEVWQLPGVMPVLAMVRIVRWAADGRDWESLDLSDAEVVQLVGDLFPEEILRSWAAMGIGIDDPRLAALVERVIPEYMLRQKSRA
jgi:hypothetical protein